MHGLYLKRRGRWWHYRRIVPDQYRNLESRSQICFSLKTQDFSQAKLLAAQISLDLEEKWQQAGTLEQAARKSCEGYEAASQIQLRHGLEVKDTDEISSEELIKRLRLLLMQASPIVEQQAVLGLIEQPELSMMDAFERFWNYIEDEWSKLSHDQIRVKRNAYLKALSNFRKAVGDIPFYQLERKHALAFRSWWLKRLKSENLKSHTGNKDINALRRMTTTNFDLDATERPNPFSRIRLKSDSAMTRIPLTHEQIKAILMPGALGKIAPQFMCLFRFLINTGARPVEIIGLTPDDIFLNDEIPHIYIRKNSVRGLKTDHSERKIPLLGVSLEAAHELVKVGGWGKYLGKNMYATSTINRHLRASGIVVKKEQSLYSLRHWFQDQLTKNDVVDRAQAQLMGHKFQRPKYGFGKDLSELKEIIEKFAL